MAPNTFDKDAFAKTLCNTRRKLLDARPSPSHWQGKLSSSALSTATAVFALSRDDHSRYHLLIHHGLEWLIQHQNPDGGWGESCASYVDLAYKGRGSSTPSQTAWALISLLAAGEVACTATERGIQHLIRTQMDDGSWEELYYTGTGFPGYGIGQRLDRYLSSDHPEFKGHELPTGFMINYHMYRNYWPLAALGRYRRAIIERETSKPDSVEVLQ